MKRLAGTLAVTGCVFGLGCGADEGSSEGLVRRVVLVAALESTLESMPPEKIQEAEDALRALPSKFPMIERFEWGRIEDNRDRDTGRDPHSQRHTHCFLVTFKDRQSLDDAAYYRALYDAVPPPLIAPRWAYVAHDATPHARTPTRGHLRRWAGFQVKQGTSPEQIQKVEDAMTALPSKIPAIERLEWGTDMGPHAPGRYFLLLTFKNASGRDACLSHPAYEEFRRLVEPWGYRERRGLEYVVRRD